VEYYNLPTFSDGNNLLVAPLEIGQGQTVRTCNLVPIARKILQKKPGSILHLEIEDANSIDSINKLVVGSDTYLIAVANFDAADKVFYSKNGAAFTEMTGGTALAANNNYDLVVMINKLYIASSGKPLQVTDDGESKADLTGTNIPLNPTHIASFKDRLWATVLSSGQWWTYISNNLDPTTYLDSMIIKTAPKQDPLMGLAPLTFTTATETISDLMMIIHKDALFGVTFTTKPIAREQYSGQGGCWDAKSIVNTPLGLMYRSRDSIMLFTGKGEPLEIGNTIKPVWDGTHISQGSSTVYRTSAACFFDGFYRIAYPLSGSSNNDREYWLDTRYGLENIGWYGDHSGLAIGCYFVDGNTIYAGSATDGKIWKLNQSTRNDNLVTIPTQLQTRFYTGDDSEYTTKIFKRFGFNLAADGNASINVKYDINQGNITNTKQLQVVVSADLWDVAKWDVAKFYAGNIWKTYRDFCRPTDRGNFISFQLDEQSLTNILYRNGLLGYLKTNRIL